MIKVRPVRKAFNKKKKEKFFTSMIDFFVSYLLSALKMGGKVGTNTFILITILFCFKKKMSKYT